MPSDFFSYKRKDAKFTTQKNNVIIALRIINEAEGWATVTAAEGRQPGRVWGGKFI